MGQLLDHGLPQASPCVVREFIDANSNSREHSGCNDCLACHKFTPYLLLISIHYSNNADSSISTVLIVVFPQTKFILTIPLTAV
jgi:hypothetical protein